MGIKIGAGCVILYDRAPTRATNRQLPGANMPVTRRATVTGGANSLDQVRAYLPANYTADEEIEVRHSLYDGYHQSVRIVIEGHDVAGWTLDDYVIPRLASGLIFAREIFDNA